MAGRKAVVALKTSQRAQLLRVSEAVALTINNNDLL